MSYTSNFHGFDSTLIDRPTYDIKTPQGLYDLTIRSMTLKDEEILKGSIKNINNPSMIVKHINKILYSVIENKNDYPELTTYQGFLDNITIDDRLALITGLYHCTYGNSFNYNISCPSCGNTFDTDIHLSDGFSILWYEPKIENNNLLKEYENIEYKLPHSKSIIFAVEPIRLSKELKIESTLPNISDEMKNFIGKIKYFRFDQSGKELLTYQEQQEKLNSEKKEGSPIIEGEIINRPLDISNAVESLLSSQKKYINEVYNRDIDEYTIDLTYNSTCPKCMKSFDFSINFIGELFRMVFKP